MKWKTSRQTLRHSAAIVRPPPRLSISQWADAKAWIPPEGNAEPGKYRLARMPHQAAMLDDLQEPGVREVFWMLASQVGGKTLCLILICEFIISELHKSIIVVRDVRERAIEWVRDKFLPTVEATPCMAGLLVEPRKRDSKSTTLSRKFPGGGIKIIGAKSAGAFRSTSCGNVFQDEIDAYMAGKEGDPCALADRAAINFSGAWKLKCSTPTVAGISRIDAGYELGDKQKYFLPCPVCGEFQHLKTEQMKFSFTAEEHALFEQGNCNPNLYTWQIGDFPIFDLPRTIYVCEHCRHGWSDFDRVRAYMSGHPDNEPVIVNSKELRAKWIATAPFKGIRSRQLNGMYISIGLKEGFASYLHQFAQMFLDAKAGGRETLMPWTNMFKAITYEDPGEKLDWTGLKKRAEDYDAEGEIPAQVVWIAWGADVHPNRVEILFFGWGEAQEAWCLSHRVIFGDFDMPSMQERVWDFLSNKRFNHPVLGPLVWSAGGMDSGHQTKVKAVYQFCAKRRHSNVYSLKGFEDLGGATVQPKTERIYGGLRLNINVDYFKTIIFDRLRNETPGPRFIHFPKESKGQFGDLFYAQICSEKRVKIKMPKGGFVMRWVKLTSATRNEVLDMTVYAHAVYEIARQEEWIARKWKQVSEKLKELHPADPIEAEARPMERALVARTEVKVPGLASEARRFVLRKRIRIQSPFGRKF